MIGAARWWELYVVRWDADHARVVDQVIAPLLEQECFADTESFLDSDWWQGPHVSMCFLAEDGPVQRLASGGLVRQAEHLLRALGPGRAVESEQHRELHERLSRYEGRPGPLFPWLPDGEVGLRLLRSREGDDLNSDLNRTIRAFHVAVQDAEIDLFRATAAGRLRVAEYALDLLATTALEFSDCDIRSTYPSFASHAEAYLGTDPTGNTRARWDAAYERHRGALLDRLQGRVVDVAAGRRPEAVRPVVQALHSVLDVVDPLALLGGSALPELGAKGMFEQSDFHRELKKNLRWQESVRQNVWFGRYRLVLNFAYLHLTKLGLTPHHRFYVCHLITRTAQELTGTTASALLRGHQRA